MAVRGVTDVTAVELGGLLLAGGGSRRFGSDKAVAVVDGVTMLDRGIACLRAACHGRVLVASGDGRSRACVADGQVADVVADGGPLAAIAAGLAAFAHEEHAVAVLAVDHLAPSAALLRLLAARRGDAACALAAVGGWRQPLHAVWSTAVADEVVSAARGGLHSPLAWLADRDDVVVLDETELSAAGIDAVTATRDADRPGDLTA